MEKFGQILNNIFYRKIKNGKFWKNMLERVEKSGKKSEKKIFGKSLKNGKILDKF